MSVFKRSRRRNLSQASGATFDAPNGTLLSPLDRVFEEKERRGLDPGYGGGTPMQATVWQVPGGARTGLARRGRLPPYQAPFRPMAKLGHLQIREPRVTLFCQQRRERREVLFAKKVAGFRRSPGRGGTYRRRAESQWRC